MYISLQVSVIVWLFSLYSVSCYVTRSKLHWLGDGLLGTASAFKNFNSVMAATVPIVETLLGTRKPETKLWKPFVNVIHLLFSLKLKMAQVHTRFERYLPAIDFSATVHMSSPSLIPQEVYFSLETLFFSQLSMKQTTLSIADTYITNSSGTLFF